MRISTIKKLNKMDACKEAVKWAKTQKNKQDAWNNCKRGDWMLWLLDRLSGESESEGRKRLVLCACDCAALALKHSGENRKVCEKALRTTRAWARGKASITDVENATYAGYAADAADYAAYAVATATADTDTDYAAARKKVLKKCANITRKHYPKAPRF